MPIAGLTCNARSERLHLRRRITAFGICMRRRVLVPARLHLCCCQALPHARCVRPCPSHCLLHLLVLFAQLLQRRLQPPVLLPLVVDLRLTNPASTAETHTGHAGAAQGGSGVI